MTQSTYINLVRKLLSDKQYEFQSIHLFTLYDIFKDESIYDTLHGTICRRFAEVDHALYQLRMEYEYIIKNNDIKYLDILCSNQNVAKEIAQSDSFFVLALRQYCKNAENAQAPECKIWQYMYNNYYKKNQKHLNKLLNNELIYAGYKITEADREMIIQYYNDHEDKDHRVQLEQLAELMNQYESRFYEQSADLGMLYDQITKYAPDDIVSILKQSRNANLFSALLSDENFIFKASDLVHCILYFMLIYFVYYLMRILNLQNPI